MARQIHKNILKLQISVEIMRSFESFYQKIYDYLKCEGIKINYKKELVIKALNNKEEPLNVSEIRDILQSKFDTVVSVNFLYSYLKQLNIAGVVGFEMQSSAKKFFLKPFKKNVIICCIKCDKQTMIYDEEIENSCWELCLNSGFSGQDFELIIYGICEKCKI